MPEEVLFQSEGSQSRSEIASYLRQVADNLDAGDDITLTAGEQSVTMTPPAQPTFEVKAEREGPTDSPGELSIEFEIEWAEDGEDGNAESGGELEIE
jgi:amphi-Trp domain-containing protein